MKSVTSLIWLTTLGMINASPSKLSACPLLGQQYPAPTQLAIEPKLQAAAKVLDAELDKNLNKFPFSKTTFSIGMFSASEDNIWQYNHASALLSNGTTSGGASKVDANSVYRIGSISKLLTVYLWLITEGDRLFGHSISEYIPELINSTADWNSLTPNWDEITIGDLAGQMGGLARDYGLMDLAPLNAAAFPIPKSLRAAFPKLSPDEIPECGYLSTNGSLISCSIDEYLNGVATESPIFQPAYTPAYSNEAFALLGIALANIAGEPLQEVFDKSLVEALGLSGTYYSTPTTISNRDVIPGDPVGTGWASDFGPFAAAGGFYSTVNDLTSIGRSVLSSSLLLQSQTNRWLKPSSFVEAYDQGVGRPWEIYRQKIHGQSIDIYAKSGDWGVYSAEFLLVPNYQVGLTILVAEDLGSEAGESVTEDLSVTLIEAILPVLDDIAREQAGVNFAGTYSSSQSNSSLTIDATEEGLMVISWVNNGVDLFESLSTFDPNLNYRIVPNGLYEGDQVGFTSFYQSAEPAGDDNAFLSCIGWVDVDELTLGNIPLGQMVFHVDGTGKATSVELRAFRTTLARR